MINLPDLNENNFLDHLDELVNYSLTPERLQRFEDVLNSRLACLTVAFDEFKDFHNVSACMRSCEIAGCSDIHIISKEEKYKLGKSSSKGAINWLKAHKYKHFNSCATLLKQQGFTLVGTLPESEGAKTLDAFELPEKLCLVMGSEHSGLSEQSLALCDDFVTIPMYGFTTSYNVSTAMAIVLHHFSECYRASGKDIFISQDYKDQLRLQWYERDIRKKFGWS